MVTSSKRYHYDAKQGVRNAKAEVITRLFTFEERTDLSRTASVIGEMPSPQNTSWRHYIEHRLRMSTNGIETYTQRCYARLGLDKHMESKRAIDKIAGKLVNHKPAIIYIGAGGSTPANSIIRIRKHVRCPGTRKLIVAIMKRGNCIIRMIDEYMTSQHCARCFKRFPLATLNDLFKKCENCVPNPIIRLPNIIVTHISKRVLQMERQIARTWREMQELGDAVAAILQDRPNTRLVSKKQRFLKNWQPNAGIIDIEGAAAGKSLTTVWNRDIVAAKLILYKGLH